MSEGDPKLLIPPLPNEIDRSSNFMHPGETIDLLGRPLAESENEAFLPAAFQKLVVDFETVAPDLKGEDGTPQEDRISTRYCLSFVNHVLTFKPRNQEEFVEKGENVFRAVGRDILGPIGASFVHEVFTMSPKDARLIFFARDATPFYEMARTFKALDPDRYPQQIEESYLNRKLCGIEDIHDRGDLSSMDDEMVAKFLAHHGFKDERPITLVEVGAWGTMIEKFRHRFPNANMAVNFFYSHNPNIYGFSNYQTPTDLEGGALEAIADSWEAFPKALKRPTRLIDKGDGNVTVDFTDTALENPTLSKFTQAALLGTMEAAQKFVENPGSRVDIRSELRRLAEYSELAKKGFFTGVLPNHTPSWELGGEFLKGWNVGRIPPISGII